MSAAADRHAELADEVLAEFGAVMREWRCVPFANPASSRICAPVRMLTRDEASQIAAGLLSAPAV